MPGRQRDGARGTPGQGRRTIGDGEAVGPRVAEVAAIERLGRLARKVAVLAETLEPRAVDLAGGSERALLVETLAGAARAPIVDRRIARPGIEGKQAAVGADPGHVRDAAYIHH